MYNFFFFGGGGKRVTIEMILHIMHIFCINGTDFELRVKNIKEQNRLNRCINSLDSASMVYISSASVAQILTQRRFCINVIRNCIHVKHFEPIVKILRQMVQILHQRSRFCINGLDSASRVQILHKRSRFYINGLDSASMLNILL